MTRQEIENLLTPLITACFKSEEFEVDERPTNPYTGEEMRPAIQEVITSISRSLSYLLDPEGDYLNRILGSRIPIVYRGIGTTDSSGEGVVVFPSAFVDDNYSVSVMAISDAHYPSKVLYSPRITARGTDGFTLKIVVYDTTGSEHDVREGHTIRYSWIAVYTGEGSE